MFKPEESSPPLTPEREAARQLLNDAERKILEALESDLGRPLTEEEECLALEPGAVIEKPTYGFGSFTAPRRACDDRGAFKKGVPS
jgi:hypothetical protein